ncbi:helix-turn-helix domain-containing protein [Roseomonas gilardii subsp. gilardii]|uniref:helix-turn-helix domain-containing protein n=1 Tax=Roseomonas gilardii TaxID=257708 RepID=UPI001FFBE24B|nr:helix-turn-helix domain-containing protein [Roseomonas gilardii]UPG72975.1 helix-turn-helix domain-containing protein [Roseomonas gilardii subsp. gilardii]
MGGKAPEKGTEIERYALYGESLDGSAVRFLHLEPIHERSGAHGWTIAPHAHAGLHQILLVEVGGGHMRAEATRFVIEPAALVLVPAGIVHAFGFRPQTDGWVITVADALVAEVTRGDPAVAALLRQPACLGSLPGAARGALSAVFAELSREFHWSAPGRSLAIEAALLRLLVLCLREAAERSELQGGTRSADDRLTDRFRALVEEDFRGGAPVAAYAAKLHVTEDRLLAACRRRLGDTPKALVQRRVMLEAQRYLLYTSLSVGEIGAALGFEDPAYFSRFFHRHAGRSPSAFRTAQMPEI